MAVRRERGGAERLLTLGLRHSARFASVHRDDEYAAAAWRRRTACGHDPLPVRRPGELRHSEDRKRDELAPGPTHRRYERDRTRRGNACDGTAQVLVLTAEGLLRLFAQHCDLSAVRGPASHPVAPGIRREPPDVRCADQLQIDVEVVPPARTRVLVPVVPRKRHLFAIGRQPRPDLGAIETRERHDAHGWRWRRGPRPEQPAGRSDDDEPRRHRRGHGHETPGLSASGGGSRQACPSRTPP